MPRTEDFDYSVFDSTPCGLDNSAPSDSKTYTAVKGFIPDNDGTLKVTMEDDSVGVYYVKGGAIYPGSIKKFWSTGTSGVTNLTILY